MSREASEALVRRYVDALNGGDIEAVLALLDADVAHDVNQGGRRIGREAFKTFLIHMRRCYRETLSDLVVMTTADGSRVAAEYTCRGTYLATDEGLPEANGQTYSIPAATLFEIDGGQITRLTSYYNLEDWIAQVRR